MTVFISYATEDEAAAKALESFLERRGMFVEAQTGASGFRPLLRADVAVMLWSNKTLFSPTRLMLERRALDAWSEGRLVLVQLDHGVLPVGLRDLRVIDAKFEAQRDIAWAAVVKSIQEAMEATRRLEDEPGRAEDSEGPFGSGAPAPSAPSQPRSQSSAPAARRRQTQGEATLWRWVFTGVIVLGGALGAASLMAGVSWVLWAVVAGVVALAALAAVVAVSAAEARSRGARGRTGSAPAKPEQPELERAITVTGGPLFVSYSRADSAQVLPAVEAIKADGRPVWLDTEAIRAGDGWAGEIVKAIRSAQRVLVMCSTSAFESDHVKREVYLADRYQRPLTPVFLEDAAPPEDFEYFFATVQALRLHETPPGERPQALAQAVAGL